MDRFAWALLDKATGKPLLAHAEKVIIEEPNVRLYDGDERTDFDSGTLTLTSHRLLWVETPPGQRALQLEMSLVAQLDTVARGFAFTSSPKIMVYLYTLPAPQSQGPVTFAKANFVKLSFRQASSAAAPDNFRKAMAAVLAQKEWLHTTAAVSPPPRAVGIEAIRQKKIEEMQAAEKSIESAFTGDLKALQEKGKEMVVLAERFTAKLAKATSGAVSEEEKSQLQTCLLNLGIDNPVTRDACKSGNAYHRELCRELAAFLAKPLADAKGILPLTDVYCLYTRARGTQLISPDDLINACRLFQELQLPYTLKFFPNGVGVITSVTNTDVAIAERAFELAVTHTFLSASSYSALLSVPLMLSEDHLLFAEKCGRLCRDDSIQGLRFYPNRFI